MSDIELEHSQVVGGWVLAGAQARPSNKAGSLDLHLKWSTKSTDKQKHIIIQILPGKNEHLKIQNT